MKILWIILLWATISDGSRVNPISGHIRNVNLVKAKSAAFRKRHNISVNLEELSIKEQTEKDDLLYDLALIIKRKNNPVPLIPKDEDILKMTAEAQSPNQFRGDDGTLDLDKDKRGFENTTWKTSFAAKGGSGPILNLHGFKSAEHRLFEYLFTGYNKHIRPTISGEVTSVFFEIALFNILEMDTKNRKMITNTEMIMIWNDLHLAWDPRDFNGIEVLRVPYYDIWVPDIIMHNTAESNYEGGVINTYAIITMDGTIELLSHALFTSVCDVDVTWYPFDEQTCDMEFASWTYDNTGIVMENGPADLSEYKDNPEFYLEDFSSVTHDVPDPCCAFPFSTILYSIQIQRRTKFSLFFYIMPGILINVCAVLVFSLPAEAGEKVGLGINSMIAMIVFLMAMTENLPPTQKIPLAGMYYGVCLTVITLNIAFSVYVQNLNYTGFRGYQVSIPIRFATVITARILRIKVPEPILEAWDMDDDDDDDEDENLENLVEEESKETPVEAMNNKNDLVTAINTDQHNHEINVKPNPKDLFKPEVVEFTDPYERRTVEALEYLAKITKEQEKRYRKDRIRQGLRDEWQFISRVLDRLLFISFGFIALLFNVIILTSSPASEEFAYCPIFMSTCEGLSEEFIIAELRKHTAFSEGAHGGGHEDIEIPDGFGGGHGGGGGGHGDAKGGHGDSKGGGHGDSKGGDKGGTDGMKDMDKDKSGMDGEKDGSSTKSTADNMSEDKAKGDTGTTNKDDMAMMDDKANANDAQKSEPDKSATNTITADGQSKHLTSLNKDDMIELTESDDDDSTNNIVPVTVNLKRDKDNRVISHRNANREQQDYGTGYGDTGGH